MNPDTFRYITELVRQRSGIVISVDKAYLLESRLLPIARRHGSETVEALIDSLRLRPNPTILTDIIEALTTNESSFFRDIKPFDILQKSILPAVAQRNAARRSLRIWSAACSTGQEPYTIAMGILESAGMFEGWQVDILATDLAAKVLQKAKEGTYTQFEVQRGLPIRMLMKYLTQDGDTWRMKDDVRRMVRFQQQNLLEDCAALGTFDVIFCRNVLIYFDEDTKCQVLERLARQLTPHGVLFLGSSETIIGLTTALRAHATEPGVFVHA